MKELIPTRKFFEIVGWVLLCVAIVVGLALVIRKDDQDKDRLQQQDKLAKAPCSGEYLRTQRQMDMLVDEAVIAADNHNELLADSLDKAWQTDSVKLSKLGPCTIYTSKTASR